jgi:hypothetical protein
MYSKEGDVCFMLYCMADLPSLAPTQIRTGVQAQMKQEILCYDPYLDDVSY